MADIYLLGKVLPWSSLVVRDWTGREIPLAPGALGDQSHGSIGVVVAFDSHSAAVEAAEDGDIIIPMEVRTVARKMDGEG